MLLLDFDIVEHPTDIANQYDWVHPKLYNETNKINLPLWSL